MQYHSLQADEGRSSRNIEADVRMGFQINILQLTEMKQEQTNKLP